MARKLIFVENGLSNFTPPTGTKAIGYVGTTFSEKSDSETNNFASGVGVSSAELGDFLASSQVAGTTVETTLSSIKIPANYFKVGDDNTFGPWVILYGTSFATSSTTGAWGWTDLTNASSRSYGLFDSIVEGGDYYVHKINVMKWDNGVDPARYWKIKFTYYDYDTSSSAFTYERCEIDGTTGVNIGSTESFSKTFGGSEVDVIISGELELTRPDDNNSDGLINSAFESTYDQNQSPQNTFWNNSRQFYTYNTNSPIISVYWSYSDGGDDNFVGTFSTDGFGGEWYGYASSKKVVKSVGYSPGAGKLLGFGQYNSEITTKITSNTELKYFAPGTMLDGIGVIEIPDITQDIYFTIKSTNPNSDVETNLLYYILPKTRENIYNKFIYA
jgi:hypothetical protein